MSIDSDILRANLKRISDGDQRAMHVSAAHYAWLGNALAWNERIAADRLAALHIVAAQLTSIDNICNEEACEAVRAAIAEATQVERAIDDLPSISKADGLKMRTGRPTPNGDKKRGGE
jgi:hypothetical protein